MRVGRGADASGTAGCMHTDRTLFCFLSNFVDSNTEVIDDTVRWQKQPLAETKNKYFPYTTGMLKLVERIQQHEGRGLPAGKFQRIIQLMVAH